MCEKSCIKDSSAESRCYKLACVVVTVYTGKAKAAVTSQSNINSLEIVVVVYFPYECPKGFSNNYSADLDWRDGDGHCPVGYFDCTVHTYFPNYCSTLYITDLGCPVQCTVLDTRRQCRVYRRPYHTVQFS